MSQYWAPAFIAVLILLIRLPALGNPILDPDEQLYLLIGDRLLHGQLPYVDLWDRKPIGLFLFYAGIRLLGGEGIVQYQLAASGCVVVTAWFIRAIVRRHYGEGAAISAALGYALVLHVLHGAGGQSAVLYNALTAFAAWCAFQANDALRPASALRLAFCAMVAMGVAIQFKYTPMVEGMFLGCWFLWRFWQLGMGPGRIVGAACAMVALALLPTAMAWGFYAAAGHGAAFVQANFESVFQRNPFPAAKRHEQIVFVLVKALALNLAACLGAWAWGKRVYSLGESESGKRLKTDALLLAGWTVSALVGFAMLGDFLDFYFITVCLPLVIVAAAAIQRGAMGFGAACLLLLWPLLCTPEYVLLTGSHRRATERMVAALSPYVAGHCLYVYDGPAILYFMTRACAPTRFLYPDHLTNPTEAPALGVDPIAEETKILASRPGAIVTASSPFVPWVAPGTQELVREALARNYVLVDRIPTFERTYFIWARSDLHPGPAPIHDPRAAIPQ